jgi:mycofactocin precursor
MSSPEPAAEPALEPTSQPAAASEARDTGQEPDFGADLNDDELGELLVREITIDGMCGVY